MAKRVAPLSAMAVARIKPDSSRTIELVDGAVPGLRLRITPAGKRTWSLNIRARGVMRRFDVGSELGLSEARQKATVLRQRIAEGADPTAEKRSIRSRAVLARKGIGTFGALIDSYFEAGPGRGLTTGDEQFRRIKSVFAAHLDRPAGEVRSADLQLTIDGHRAKVAAARATAYLLPVIKWARKRGLLDGTFDLEKPLLDRPRQRTLTNQELSILLPALDDAYGSCCRFLLLTGARLDEARSATWSQLDLEARTWTIPGESRKDTRTRARRQAARHEALEIPLSRQAVALLEQVRAADLARRQADGREVEIAPQDRVFVGPQGGQLINWDRWLKAISSKTGVTSWSAHALRRTTATLAGELGAPPHVVSAILGHANIGGQLVAGYNKSRYAREHAEALQKVADHLLPRCRLVEVA
ncbi:MAG: tyrosine-type recombinase/integrase [Croceibacterium sp.]